MPTSITLAFGNDLWETILMCRAIRYISYMETEKHSIVIEKERHGELESKALPPTYLSFLYPSALYVLKESTHFTALCVNEMSQSQEAPADIQVCCQATL